MSTAAVEAKPATVSIPTTGTTKTPPGYNKTKRIITRGLLGIAAIGLTQEGYSSHSLACSSLAFLTMKEGTFWSFKNLKWMILTLITFCVSLWSTICMENAETFGVQRAYMMSAAVRMTGRTPELMWGYILGMFVTSAFMTNNKEMMDQAQTVLQEQVIVAGNAVQEHAGKIAAALPPPPQPSAPQQQQKIQTTKPTTSTISSHRPPPMNPQYQAKIQ